MQTPIVRTFRDDILNKNPENQIRGEPFTTETPGEFTRVIVPRQSPFFIKSLKLYFMNGEPMTEEHWEIYAIMPGLTALAAQGVACMIRLKDPSIVLGLLDYDVVGEFTLFDTAMMNMVVTATEDDRMIDWNKLKEKPIVFPPALHPHSLLYDIVAFEDTIHLLNSISDYSNGLGTPLIETKISCYFANFNHYLALYKGQLLKFLNEHKNTYNEHGIKAIQVGLEKVDNFPTAIEPLDLLGGRADMHLTVQGLATIVNQTGVDASEYLVKGSLPVSQFGNTNFIPPAIGGSYEGLGGQTETAAISQESDGSVVFLENRFDGRADGLYYSVMKEPYSPARLRAYTGYRYTHQRVDNDAARVNRVAAGSGDEVILVADTNKDYFYVGLTHGSLDPAKHVLSRISMAALMAELPTGERASDHIAWMQVMLMGDWIYVSFAHTYVNRVQVAGSPGGERRYRYYYRVPKADVEAQLTVTAAAVRLTYVDPDGVSRTNADYFRLYTPQGVFPNWTKCYFPIKQTSGTVIYGNLYAQHCLVAEIPTKPGKYVMKIIGAFLGSYASSNVSGQFQTEIEATYEFDPDTGVMTLLHKTPQPQLDFTNLFIDWSNPPANWQTLPYLVYAWDRQGMNILPDGTIMASTGDYQSFPRGYCMIKPRETRSKYETLSRQWNTGLGPLEVNIRDVEAIVSPLVSGVKPKAFLLGNGGDFYIADSGVVRAKNKLYYRQAAGGLASRADVQNLLLSNIRSRPLRNTVWEVRGNPKVGGATVTVPSNALATYATDLGDLRFCVGTQRRYLDLPDQSAEWVQPTDLDSIKVMTSHTTRINNTGKMEIVPTSSIMYPAAIVARLKLEVDLPSQMTLSPDAVVVICDPTGSMTDKYGWLPVLVWISWGRVGTTERHDTMLNITPVYSEGVDRVVTDYTVLDKIHLVTPTGAVGLLPGKWDAYIAGDMNFPAHGAPRVGYYLSGSTITGFFDSGITAQGQGDSLQMYGEFRISNRGSSKRWSTTSTNTFIAVGNGNGNAHRTVTPDNGVVVMIPHSEAAGGAATIFSGTTYNALLGSVYPEVGWVIFFKEPIKAVFNGKEYMLPAGVIDLRDLDSSPGNKTFYIYALLKDDDVVYDVTQEKRLETAFNVWVGTAVTSPTQILTIERFNVFTINGSRISEIKRGNSIPASSGLVNVEGQIPWLRSDEMLP